MRHALVKLIDDWMECNDKGDMVGALFIDFRKAFDLVDHKILLHKLYLYKFDSSSIEWFRSYLCSRQQTIESEKGLSDFTTVISGVPQGSILGSTLFIIFINDLPLYLKNCSSDLYADDTTVHTHNNSIDTIEASLQSELGNTKTWSKKINMDIHMTKTSCMLVGTKKRLSDSRALNIKIDDVTIKKCIKAETTRCIYWWKPHLIFPYRPLMFNCFIQNIASTTISNICTNQCPKAVLPGIYPALYWLWLCCLGCSF